MTDSNPPAPVPWIRLVRFPLGVLAGVVTALGAPPYDLWYLALIGLLGAVWLFDAAPKGLLSAGTGWAVGLGYFGFALGWIVEPFQVDPVTRWMAPFGLIGLAAGLALFWALAFWAAGQVSRFGLGALVLFWAAAEFARAYVFTGFPWALLPYFWLETPVIQWVSVIGPHGLTLATLGLAALAVSLVPWATDKGLRIAAMGGLAAALWGGGVVLTPPLQDLADRPVVRLVQPNAPQHEKWDPALIPVFFDRQLRFTAAAAPTGARPALVIWPEIAVPWLLHRADEALALVSEAAQGARVVLGIQRVDAGAYYNAAIALGPAGQVEAVYDKHHLVPFGEYMPAAALFRRWNIFGLAARADGGYAAGPGPRLIDLGPLGRALPLICYEAVFPQDVNAAPGRADLLVHLTNDAWFGEWSGPYQHLAQSRVRAIEQGLPMLRSANTGVSAVIDGAGRVLDALPLGQAGFVDAPLPPPMRATLYSRSGDWPVLVLLGLGAAALFVALRVKSD